MALKIQEEYIKTLKKAENIYITSPLTGNGRKWFRPLPQNSNSGERYDILIWFNQLLPCKRSNFHLLKIFICRAGKHFAGERIARAMTWAIP